MKVSLFGYNRKETDEYFNYLNENSNIQAEKIRSLEEKLAEAQKSIDEYRKLDEINRQEIETLNDTVEQYRAEDEDQKRQIDELTRKLDGKTDVPESDRLGFIFAVAYRDIANKNKAVSAKIVKVKQTARSLLFMDIHETEFSPVIVSHHSRTLALLHLRT